MISVKTDPCWNDHGNRKIGATVSIDIYPGQAWTDCIPYCDIDFYCLGFTFESSKNLCFLKHAKTEESQILCPGCSFYSAICKGW